MSAKVILSLDGLVLKEIPLNKERISIGRKPVNDIQIDNLAISGQHAQILTLREDSFLEDLNSTNGTRVNGQPVRRHVLKNGDVIELGKYKMKFVSAAQNGLVTTRRDLAVAHTAAAEVADIPAVQVGVLQVLSGGNAGREIELTKAAMTLGKSGAQVAVITRRSDGYFITHVEGDHFPSLNGRELDAQAHRLHDKDVIEIAGIKMAFFQQV
jgi:pSer/pThr/pTyr-binding forkhead associated (FHA) protein